MALSREEIRSLVREEIRPELDQLEALIQANQTLAKAVERLSIVTAGDPTLGVTGLLTDVTALKNARQENTLQQAKRAGIILAITTLGGGVVTGLWALVQWLLERKE